MWWRMIVWALLTAPEPVDLPVADYPPEALAALQAVAYELEIADPREPWGQFSCEVTACRMRYQELASVPRLAETYWLPPPEISRENSAFAFGLECGLMNRTGFSAWEDERLIEAAQEAHRLGWIWLWAEGAADERGFLVQRRHALGNLKAALGPDWWCACRLPQPVPLSLLGN